MAFLGVALALALEGVESVGPPRAPYSSRSFWIQREVGVSGGTRTVKVDDGVVGEWKAEEVGGGRGKERWERRRGK